MTLQNIILQGHSTNVLHVCGARMATSTRTHAYRILPSACMQAFAILSEDGDCEDDHLLISTITWMLSISVGAYGTYVI